jgi:phosphoribosylformimino-5-aminoimidazole carboxamide ribotide isomerase
MIIFPAIDIKGGKCVRLLKGDFNKVTQYEKLPAEQAEIFFNLGFKNIHIIDLDGALEGKLVNKNIIKNILNKSNLKIQYGGGVRSLQDVDDLLNLGVDKVIVGTIAIENMEFLKDACKRYKDKIVVALDVRNGFIASSGWKKQTRILASEFVKKIEFFKISRIIYTDINKDGTKTGPNIKDTSNFSKLTKIPVVVSGGISSINDIKSIKENFPNLYGVIVGKAIYDGTIDIRKLSTI